MDRTSTGGTLALLDVRDELSVGLRHARIDARTPIRQRAIYSDDCPCKRQLEHCAAKRIRFAIENAAQQSRELIPAKWKQL